jgi:hypothetical protein
MSIKIVDFPIDSMVIFHSFLSVYQSVTIFFYERGLEPTSVWDKWMNQPWSSWNPRSKVQVCNWNLVSWYAGGPAAVTWKQRCNWIDREVNIYILYIYILYQTLACLSACFCQFIRIESLSPKHSPIHSPIHSPMHSPDWCNWCWYSISQ